jgi:hypothetical protein
VLQLLGELSSGGFTEVAIFSILNALLTRNIETEREPVLYDNIFTWMCGTTPTKKIVTQGSKGGYQQNKGAEAAQMSKIEVMAAICKTGHGAKRKKKESKNYSLWRSESKFVGLLVSVLDQAR